MILLRFALSIAVCLVAALAGVRPARAQEEATEFGATAVVEKERAGEHSVSLEETRAVPGGLGDPMRVIETLPGVTPIASGLPYGYVRGAPPATTGYYYDGISLPQLYHFALGPAVIHPRLFGPVQLYAGVAPARYGRRLGGAVEAGPPATGSGEGTGEAELRLLDANAYVEEPVGDGLLRVAGRYGYPGLVLSLWQPETTLSYWDYGARWLTPLGGGADAELIVFGSSDELVNPPFAEDAMRFNEVAIEFHRVEARLMHRRPGLELGSALRVGYDESSLDRELAVRAFSAGPRLWAKARLSSAVRLHVGADMLGSTGDIESVVAQAPPVLSGRRELRVDLPQVADVPARNAGGSFAELSISPGRVVELELGARVDAWLVSGDTSVAADPRARVTVSPLPEVAFHAAAGLTHQPAVYLFPIPGLTEVALDRGLQEAVQSDAGVALSLPGGYRIELQAYWHSYSRLLLPELYAPIDGATVPTVDAVSYGVETFLRLPDQGRLSGWVSYTLGWASADPQDGEPFAPEFDVRHVLNTVAQLTLLEGLTLGGRLHLRSGRPFNQFEPGDSVPVYEVRLPTFARVDLRLAYGWAPSWGAMLVYAEWLNLTLAEEELGAECLYGNCTAQTAPAIFLPNVGVRASW